MKRIFILIVFLSLFFNVNIYSQDNWLSYSNSGDKIAYGHSNLLSNPVFIFFRKGAKTPIPTLTIAVNKFKVGEFKALIQFDNKDQTTLKVSLIRESGLISMDKVTGNGYNFYKIYGNIGPLISGLKESKSLNINIRDYYDGKSRPIADKNISLKGSSSAINFVLGIKPKPKPVAKAPVKVNPNLNNNRYDLVDNPPKKNNLPPVNYKAKEEYSSGKGKDNSNTIVWIAGIIILLGIVLYVRRTNKEKENNTKSKNIKKPAKRTPKKVIKTPPVVTKKIQNKKPEIDIEKISWNANGSGLLLTKDGYIATNNHVVSSEEYTIKTLGVEFNYKDEIKTFKAKVIKCDTVNDLAIIKIVDKNFKGLNSIPYSAIEDEADLGEEVFALGYPMALTHMGNDIKFTDGRISSKTGYQGNISTYQTTTPIQAGSSGGPLFDFKGNLLGINSSGLDKKIADNVAYTIKTSYLRTLLNVLPKKIELPKKNNFEGLSNTEKIKILTKYVVLIKIELV